MNAFKKNPCVLFVFFLVVSPLLLRAGFEIKIIQSPADLPEPFCSLGQRGDILLSDGRTYALMGASPRLLVTSANYPRGNAMGSILSFVPAGKNLASDLNIGSPVLRLNDKTHYVSYTNIGQIKPGLESAETRFEALGFYEDKEGRKARVKTTYIFSSETRRVDIISTITNTGKSDFDDLSYSLFFDAYDRYYFNPYNEKKFPNLNFRVYQKKGHFLGWVNFNPIEEEDNGEPSFPGKLGPGEEYELRYALLTDASSLSLLEKIYEILDTKPARAVVSFKDFSGNWMELVVREAFSSSIVYRAILENVLSTEIPLPPGMYRFQANFFPATVEELGEVRLGEKNSCDLENPPLGLLKVRVKNSRGEFVPGKVTFMGLALTRSPYFQPDNPVETGRSWERVKNSCFPGREGLEVILPVGTYLACASHGPECTIDLKAIEVVKEENREIDLVIDQAVDTPSLIAFDPHMHTRRSDGRVSVSERIKEVLAEGLEVIVATDHNTITDYLEVIKKLGLDEELAIVFGSEVTVADVIHYNTYPMAFRPGEPGDGAILATADEAALLFLASREKNPAAVLQVNHPRAGDLGYFNNLYLDPESAATALIQFNPDFDLLEVLNGPYFYSSNAAAIEDWFHLLNRGYYFPIVGASDSHGIDGDETGYSRTYVFYDGEKGSRLDSGVITQALRKGRAFVTNGPIVEFKVNGRNSSGELVPAKDGIVAIRVDIHSAPWVDVDEIRLILNGERKYVFPVSGQTDSGTAFEKEISLALDRDTYICVEVLGKKTLFPVLQDASPSGSLKNGTLPYALTNPVFVDADGNAKFDPLFNQKIQPVVQPGKGAKKTSR